MSATYDIRPVTKSDQDLHKVWQMWQAIFPTWPIDEQRLTKILTFLPGHHYIHEHGFCLSFLLNGAHGRIAALGVLPEWQGKGIGSALLETAKEGLRSAAEGELKDLEIGSVTPRFWPQMPSSFPQEVKDFFIHRGFKKSSESGTRDLYKDIRTSIAPPEILERVAKSNIRFAPWSSEGTEECIAKQHANFTWFKAYEALAAYGQHHEAMVAFDPETNEQIGWTLMCSPSAIVSDIYAFMPLVPSDMEKTGLIAAVGVDEKARGKGVGLALVVKAIENLRERGIEGVFIDMVSLDGFYERLGFETLWQYEGYAL